MSQHFRFYLDGNEIQDPQNWRDITVNLERSTEINALFTTYAEKLTFVGDGYTYLIDKIDTQYFCGEVRFEIYEYINEGRKSDGFAFNGIIDLSNCEVDKYKGKITVSPEEDTLVNVFKKYSNVDIPVNNRDSVTLNGEALADIGIAIEMLPPAISIYPFTAPNSTLGFITFSDLFQYLLSYMTDNRMTLDSDLLQTVRFDDYLATITFATLGGGDTSTITWTAFNGDVETFTLSGPQTDAQHASAFVNAVSFHYSAAGAGDVLNNDMSTFPFVVQSVTSPEDVSIAAFHNPDFDLGSFASIVVTRAFTDGALNCGITTPYYIQKGDTIGQELIITFDSLYKEFAATYDTEMVFKKVNGQYLCYIEKISEFINNAAPTLTITEENLSNFKESIADDKIYRNLKYSQNSTEEDAYLFRDANYFFSGCGIKEKRADLQYYYGAERHYNVIPNTNTIEDIMPLRYDDEIYSPPDKTWYAMNLTGIDDSLSAPNGYSYRRWLVGDFAIHPLIIKRRLETIRATAKYNNYEISGDNPYSIIKVIEFDYPLPWTDYKLMLDDPSSPINIIYSTGQEKKAWIKKVKYNVLTGITNFELYTS